ncbi:hypothetical protein, partial [Methylobacterium sp. CCH5-D2]
ETRQPRTAAQSVPPGRPLRRIALASALGVAGLGAFAAASALMSDLTGSRGAPVRSLPVQQSAVDWPDLTKDGLPALATGSLPGADAPRRIALPPAEAAPAQNPAGPVAGPAPSVAPKPPAAVEPPVALSPDLPAPRTAAIVPPAPVPAAQMPPAPKSEGAQSAVGKPALTKAASAKPAPTIENAPVIAPARQAGVLPPPSRTAPTVAARPAET